MHERHLRAVRDVETRSEGGGSEHSDNGHAVHVVGYGFAGCDVEAAPAFALRGFKALEEVEEGDGGRWWVDSWR